jgi:Rrf2 family protein
MRMSDGVEWAVHCCTVLAAVPEGVALPSSRLAEFHGVPPAYLAKHLQALSRAGIVTSVPGPRGGYRLARAASEITVWDVVAAVEGDDPAFVCTEIRRRGPSGLDDPKAYARACGIARVMAKAEVAWRAELKGTSIDDLVVGITRDIRPEAAVKAAQWFQEVLR